MPCENTSFLDLCLLKCGVTVVFYCHSPVSADVSTASQEFMEDRAELGMTGSLPTGDVCYDLLATEALFVADLMEV